MATYDGSTMGGGHNGLTLGASMARAGLTVAVLGRTPHIGGGANGGPGDTAANAIANDLKPKRPWAPVPPPEWRD